MILEWAPPRMMVPQDVSAFSVARILLEVLVIGHGSLKRRDLGRWWVVNHSRVIPILLHLYPTKRSAKAQDDMNILHSDGSPPLETAEYCRLGQRLYAPHFRKTTGEKEDGS